MTVPADPKDREWDVIAHQAFEAVSDPAKRGTASGETALRLLEIYYARKQAASLALMEKSLANIMMRMK